MSYSKEVKEEIKEYTNSKEIENLKEKKRKAAMDGRFMEAFELQNLIEQKKNDIIHKHLQRT